VAELLARELVGPDHTTVKRRAAKHTSMALLQGGVAGEGRPAPDGAYAGVTERRTEWGLAAASIRLITTAPMATSVR
jgi:hypothetical protein